LEEYPGQGRHLYFSPNDTPTERAERLNEFVETLLQLFDSLGKTEAERGKATEAQLQRAQEALVEISNWQTPALNNV
jgi:hypothetical protein